MDTNQQDTKTEPETENGDNPSDEQDAHKDEEATAAPTDEFSSPPRAEAQEKEKPETMELPREPAIQEETTAQTAVQSRRAVDTRAIPLAIAFLVIGFIIGNTSSFARAPRIAPIAQHANQQTTRATHATGTSQMASALAFVAPDTPRENIEQPSELASFANLHLEAQAAYVWDIQTRRALFKKNPDERLPLASLAKVMTAVTALDFAPRGTVITLDTNALANEGDTGLRPGEQWRLKDLLELMLVTSSNDGAAAIAHIIGSRTHADFVDAMNRKAQEIGLTQTTFANESGLDINEHTSGAYGSARDVARLLEYALGRIPEALEATTRQDTEIRSESGIFHEARNTNVLVEKIPALVASKTGYTTLAGGNLAIVFEAGPGRKIVVVVLGSSYDGRFGDIEKLVWETMRVIGYIDKEKPS